MRNNLNSLKDDLYEQLERINDDSLSGEELDKALRKADNFSKIAKQIIDIDKHQLDVAKFLNEAGYETNNLPKALGYDE